MVTTRSLDDRELAYDRLADSFAESVSAYDTDRRLETLIDEFLAETSLQGLRTLDVGCGLGFFSRRLAERGAAVTACDVSPALVRKVAQSVGCPAVVGAAPNLVEQFGERSFDLVVSSECIEHTPDPAAAVRQMTRLLVPGGRLSLSTPNWLWQPVVRLASRLRLRPFDGFENFSTWRGLRRVLREQGMTIVRERGLHLFPFQFGLHRLSTRCDQRAQFLRGLMLNICLLARRDP